MLHTAPPAAVAVTFCLTVRESVCRCDAWHCLLACLQCPRLAGCCCCWWYWLYGQSLAVETDWLMYWSASARQFIIINTQPQPHVPRSLAARRRQRHISQPATTSLHSWYIRPPDTVMPVEFTGSFTWPRDRVFVDVRNVPRKKNINVE